MKSCPVCGSYCFDDQSFCLTCLHTWPEQEEVEEVEEEPVVEKPDTTMYEKFKPWWMKAGFEQFLGADAKLKFNLSDAAEDCFVYRRLVGEYEEFIYFVDGWHQNDQGKEAEIFASKALIRRFGVPVACEYSHITDTAFDELCQLEKRYIA